MRRGSLGARSPTSMARPEMFDVLVQQLGTEEGPYTIAKWHVFEGTEIHKGGVLCEIDAGKAIVEIVSEVSGTVSLILKKEGEEVAVGESLCSIVDGVD